MKTLIQFGAGNIGRSFIGQIFARAGYQVIFVDIDERIIRALNERRGYQVVIKHSDGRDEILPIENVRAIDGRDARAVAEAVAEADIAATSVGQRALPTVLKTLAAGLELRRQRHETRPLEIIIAENLHGAAAFFREHLARHLSADYPLDKLVGLVETSIGKMVPIMREEDLRRDPVWVFAEPYNELILDAKGFRGPIPDVPGLAPKPNIAAWVDRKLFIHNLGHSATAYLGYAAHPDLDFIWQVLQNAEIRATVRRAMMQSAEALLLQYPADFSRADLEAHVDDLLERFANRSLGDTVHRVGRDLYRKLSREDRLIGAIRLATRHGLLVDAMAQTVVAAIGFRKGDEKGQIFPDDQRFAQDEAPQGLSHILHEVCGLSEKDPTDQAVVREVLRVD
ncbi:mannitol-1-phosphate 5-dehydrogenase [bacterium]|nr:mannitol-1-phosphate 5-dehydrogenase [bacterium]